MDWASSDPVTSRFVADFKKKYGKDPTFFNANYYNAVWVTAKAMASLERGAVDHRRDDRNELLAIKTFDAVGGKMNSSPTATVVLPMQINELDQRRPKILQ